MADANRLAAALRYQQQMSEALPMEGRATFLPFRDTLPGSVMNKREFALPGIVAGAMNAITAPRRAMQGGYEADEAGNITPKFNAPEEAMNVAGNLMGGGMAIGRAPAGSLGMNVTREGRIPETASDVSKLADLLAKRADSAKIDYIHDKSKISPSEYFQFTKPDGEPVKLRISNHLEVYKGNDLSVDPQSKITFEEAIKSLQNSGIPIPNKAIADKSIETKTNKLYSNLDKKLPMKMMNQLWDIDSIKDQKQKYEALLKLSDSIKGK